jgi:hypothetical protein
VALEGFAEDRGVAEQARFLGRALADMHGRELNQRWNRLTEFALQDEPSLRDTFVGDRFSTRVYGTAVVIRPEGERLAVLFDRTLGPTPAGFADPPRASDVEGVSNVMRELGADAPLDDIVALPIAPPEPYFAPGERVSGGGAFGTLGALVTTAAGTDGILTAGHVASPGALVQDDAGATGLVTFSIDPAQVSGPIVTADVAVIEPLSWRAMSPPCTLAATATATGANAVTATGTVSGRQNGVIMGMTAYLYVPKMAGQWGDVYFTTAGISTGGDSGAPVTLAGTNDLIGHVVGGSPPTTSFVQEIDFQLKAVGATFRPGP